MRVVGVDPGKTGGLVLIADDETQVLRMPVTAGEVDGRQISSWLFLHSPDIVILEKVGARPKQGVKSMFTFGMGYGVVKGVLETLVIPYRLVLPQAWKRAVLAGTKKDKDAAIAFIRTAYPTINLIPEGCRTPQDGIADAACMAVWGREHMRTKP
jgi:crossover junction endodeoxyribonuclease RuvC